MSASTAATPSAAATANAPTTGSGDSFARVGYRYRPALDGIRALAVIAVVAYHLDGDVVPGGFLGVDIFFVLSGYLIAGLLLAERTRDGRISLAAFWVRRARRLLPALGGVLVAVAAYAQWWAPTTTLDRLRTDAWAAILYVANWRFALSEQSYFDSQSVLSPLRHTWSLAVEEQFYILFPLLAIACCRGRHPARTLGIVSAVGAIASALMMALFVDATDPSFVYYATHTRAQGLLVGVVLACWSSSVEPTGRVARDRALQGIGTVGLGTVLAAVYFVDEANDLMYQGGYLLAAVAVAAVVGASVRPGRLQRVLSVAPLRWIGQRSYGAYLWHWPAIVALEPARTGLDGWRLAAVRIVATLVATEISWRLIETPIRTGALPRWRFGRVSIATTLLLVPALFVTTLGVTTPAFEANAGPPSVGSQVAQPEVLLAAAINDPPPTVANTFEPRTIAVIGDSVPASAMAGFEAEATAHGTGLISFVVPGCGLAIGLVSDDDGNPISWTEDCAAVVRDGLAKMITDHDPDLVVWWSGWETADRIVDGEHVSAGTREWSEDLDAAFEDRWNIVTSNGARVVLVDTTPNAASPVGEANRDPDGAIAALRVRLHDFAARHPGRAAVVEFSSVLCPDGVPCPREIDDVVPRPDDGGHFTDKTATWAIARLWPLCEAAWRQFAR